MTYKKSRRVLHSAAPLIPYNPRVLFIGTSLLSIQLTIVD